MINTTADSIINRIILYHTINTMNITIYIIQHLYSVHTSIIRIRDTVSHRQYCEPKQPRSRIRDSLVLVGESKKGNMATGTLLNFTYVHTYMHT